MMVDNALWQSGWKEEVVTARNWRKMLTGRLDVV